MRITISRAMLTFGIVLCACFAVLIGISWTALLKLEVNGPVFRQIASGMELIGDILPPPEYIIEPYLEANLAARNPDKLDQHKLRLVALRKDYTVRHDYWVASAIPAEVKTLLTETSDRDVQEFWRKLDADVLPAIQSRDNARITAALDDLGRVYESHRRTIDAIVSAANAMNDRYMSEASLLVGRYTWILGLGSALVAGVILAGLFLLARRIARPLSAMTRHMGAMAAGSFDQSAPFLGRHDELGDMAAAMETFRAAFIEKNRLEAETAEIRRLGEIERTRSEVARARAEADQTRVVAHLAAGLGALAKGDLVLRLEDEFAAEYDQLRVDFNAAMGTLLSSMTTVTTVAAAIHAGSSEISVAADDLSRRTEQQAASLEETAAALDQITASVKKMSSGAVEARSAVAGARTDAERSGAVVGRAVTAMSAIAGSSQQIGRIIGVIDEIAFQTNLLALNAGVEAARAGDAGRGFAVVASEVRALAQRSAEAAKDIKNLIATSSAQVEQGVESVGEAGAALERILGQVVGISSIISDIAASAQEQAMGLDQVNTAVNQMDQVTQQNAAMVEESTAASKHLAHEASALAQLMGQFETGAAAAPRVRQDPAPPISRPGLKTVGSGGPAPKIQSDSQAEWEEF